MLLFVLPLHSLSILGLLWPGFMGGAFANRWQQCTALRLMGGCQQLVLETSDSDGNRFSEI